MRKALTALTFAAGLVWIAFAALEPPKAGAPAPEFLLTDTNGKKHALSDYKKKYVVLEWINHGCPFVKKHYESGNMQRLQSELTTKGVVWLSICSSAKGKEGHLTPAEWNKKTKDMSATPTAVLLDANGRVGKLYGATNTPHMFIINPAGNVIYKGAIDDKPSYKREDVDGAHNYVQAALAEAMDGKNVSTPSTQAYGCSVKYK